jgi:hypothetical protein
MLAAFAYCSVIEATDTPMTIVDSTNNIIIMEVILFVFSHQL